MFTISIIVALVLVIALGVVFSPVILFVGMDVLAVVGIIKLIVGCFRKKKK